MGAGMRIPIVGLIAAMWLAGPSAGPSAAQPAAQSASGESPQRDDRPRVLVLTTGGTIASRTGAASLAGNVLVDAVPQLADHADVEVEEVVRIGSSKMTPEIWVLLGRRINERFSDDPDLAGIVVTHGTDSMEETGYFLNLTVRDDRPVVVVGSMRPATAVSADGPANLLDAVRVAADPGSRGRGVLVVLNDEIHEARAVRKTDNQRVDAFRSPERGVIGYADPDRVLLLRRPSHRHTQASEFDVSQVGDMPEVPIVADYAGFDGSTIAEWVEKGADGIVVMSFAGGRMSAGATVAAAAALAAGVPVVVSSRVLGGRIPGPPAVAGSILARDLSPQKARVLLMVALAHGVSMSELGRVFDEY